MHRVRKAACAQAGAAPRATGPVGAPRLGGGTDRALSPSVRGGKTRRRRASAAPDTLGLSKVRRTSGVSMERTPHDASARAHGPGGHSLTARSRVTHVHEPGAGLLLIEHHGRHLHRLSRCRPLLQRAPHRPAVRSHRAARHGKDGARAQHRRERRLRSRRRPVRTAVARLAPLQVRRRLLLRCPAINLPGGSWPPRRESTSSTFAVAISRRESGRGSLTRRRPPPSCRCGCRTPGANAR